MFTIGLRNRFLQVLAVSATLLTGAVSGFSQGQTGQPQSQKGAVLKGKAPVSKEVLKVRFPKPIEARLSNGLRVFILENHRIPVFAMQAVVLSGGLSDATDRIGAAQYTAQLLREGTRTRSSKEIAEQIEALGASLGATSGLSNVTTNVTASGLTDNLDKILELFGDVLINPTFSEEEFNKLKTRSLASLRANRGQAEFLANEKFAQVMYGKHPASRTSVSSENWDRLSPEVLRSFHARNYVPNNTLLAISGDVDPKTLIAKLEKVLGGWKPGDVAPVAIPAVAALGPSKIALIDRPGSVQTNLLLGTLSLERNDPDYPALQVMDRVVGGGPASRLFLNLREEKGYTYGAYSSVSASKYRGTFTASTEVRTDVTDGSMKELMYELNRIRNDKVGEKELEDAKRSIVGIFALQLESPQSLLNNFIMTRIYDLGDDYWNTYPQKIAAVTAEDVQRMAKKYLDLEHLQIVAVGDGKKVYDVLRKYGKVDVFDSDGKPRDLNAPPPPASTSGTGGSADVAGAWDLTLKTPDGNEMPLKANITSASGKLGGSLESMMGPLQIAGGDVKGDDVGFKATGEIQGQKVELLFAGKVTGNQLKGTLTIQGAPFPPLEVAGTRAK